MSTASLPAAAQRFIDATNQENRQELLDAFAPDGTVEDFGRSFTGREAIGRWSDRENIGTNNRITVHRVTGDTARVVAEISVAGNGYNGHGALEFHLRDDHIDRLVISG